MEKLVCEVVVVNKIVSNGDGYGILPYTVVPLETSVVPGAGYVMAPEFIVAGYNTSTGGFIAYMNESGVCSPLYNQNDSRFQKWVTVVYHPETGGVYALNLNYSDLSSIAKLSVVALNIEDIRAGKFNPRFQLVAEAVYYGQPTGLGIVGDIHFIAFALPAGKIFVLSNEGSIIVDVNTSKSDRIVWLPNPVVNYSYNSYTNALLLQTGAGLHYLDLNSHNPIAYSVSGGFPSGAMWTATPDGFKTIVSNGYINDPLDPWYYLPIIYTVSSDGVVSSKKGDIHIDTQVNNGVYFYRAYGNADLNATGGYGGNWFNKFDTYIEKCYTKTVLTNGHVIKGDFTQKSWFLNNSKIPSGNEFNAQTQYLSSNPGSGSSAPEKTHVDYLFGILCQKGPSGYGNILSYGYGIYDVRNELNGWYALKTGTKIWGLAVIPR